MGSGNSVGADNEHGNWRREQHENSDLDSLLLLFHCPITCQEMKPLYSLAVTEQVVIFLTVLCGVSAMHKYVRALTVGGALLAELCKPQDWIDRNTKCIGRSNSSFT